MGPQPGNGLLRDFSCTLASALRSGGGWGRLRGALLTLTPPTEGEGELRRPAPQPGPELPLPLPGELQHRPEPESGLPHLPTLGRPIVTTSGTWTRLFGAKDCD